MRTGRVRFRTLDDESRNLYDATTRHREGALVMAALQFDYDRIWGLYEQNLRQAKDKLAELEGERTLRSDVLDRLTHAVGVTISLASDAVERARR